MIATQPIRHRTWLDRQETSDIFGRQRGTVGRPCHNKMTSPATVADESLLPPTRGRWGARNRCGGQESAAFDTDLVSPLSSISTSSSDVVP